MSLRHGLLFSTESFFSINDAGTGTESAVVGHIAAETGTGTDAAFAPTAVETATATETAVRPCEVFDTASFDDLYHTPPVALYALSIVETGSGTEDSIIPGPRATETGTRTETATLIVTLTVAETGTADDGNSGQDWTAADTATGAEWAAAPTGIETGTITEGIDRDFIISDTGDFENAIGDRDITLLETGTADESIDNLNRTLFDNWLAMDVAIWGVQADDTATGSETGTSSRIAREFGHGSETGNFSAAGQEAADETVEVFESAELTITVSSDDATAVGAETATVSIAYEAAETGTFSASLTIGYGLEEFYDGVDAGEVTVVMTGAETPTGLDEYTLTATAGATETGSGAEVGTVTTELSCADTGSGSEAGFPDYSVAQESTLADAGTLAAEITGAETGSGLDETTLVVTDLSASQSGTASDVGTVGAEWTAADTGTGTEAFDAAWNALYYATGTDAGVLTAAIVGEEAGTLLDETSVAIGLAPVEQAGTGADAGTVAAEHTAADTATLAEVISPSFVAPDWATAADDTVLGLTGEETATGAETAYAPLGLDTATGTDAVVYGPWYADEATGSDTVMVTVYYDETGSGVDFATPAWGYEYVTATDLAHMGPGGNNLENSVATETWVIDATISGHDDEATVWEDLSLAASVAGADSTGVATDAGSIVIEHTAVETATLSEGGMPVAAPEMDPDVGYAEDAATVTVSVSAAETAVQVLTASWLPAGAYEAGGDLKGPAIDQELDLLG